MKARGSAQSKQEAARERVRQAPSGHWPTIKVQAGRTRYENDRQSYWDDDVQVQVEAPLYQGGMVNAKTQSAEGDREAAQAAVHRPSSPLIRTPPPPMLT